MNDFLLCFKYWLAILGVGAIFFPLTSSIFKKFHDRGWIFSKGIGLAISSWLMWLLSYIKLFKFSSLSVYIVLLLCGIVNWGFYLKNFKKRKDKNFDFSLFRNILISELIFTFAFGIFAFLKGFTPMITNTTEQFMDYGFMNSIFNSTYMPPRDMWFSGEHINYYYYGIYVASYICKIAFLRVNEGYNLMIALISGLSFSMSYSIGFNLIKDFKYKFSKVINYLVPLIVSIAICFGGTLHYPIYRWFAEGKDKYFYPDETRYIGFKPDTNDKAVTEIPSYSFVVSDLHPHYIDLIFVFVSIALLLQLFLTDKEDYNKHKIKWTVLLSGFMLGIQKMTNYWDFPIYFVIISSCICVKHFICNKFSKKNLLWLLANIGLVLAIEELITLPFTLDLYVGTTTVLLTGTHSPFYKLAVLWGLQAFCFALFLYGFYIGFKKSKVDFREYLSSHLINTFIVILGICAFGLIFLPEVVYIKDIYGDSYKRFNTMFKLTYQAFILLVFCTNYVIFKLMSSKNRFVFFVASWILLANVLTLGYGFDAIKVNIGDRSYSGIVDSEQFVRTTLPNEYEAIKWFQDNVDRESVLVEATSYGNSYSTNSLVSVFTGNPTVLGWAYHEWLWRVNKDLTIPESVATRNTDIANFYTSNDSSSCKEFLDKYNVSYIYIGNTEYSTFSSMNVDLLLSLGEVVYEGNDTDNKVYIVKVAK